MVTDEARRLFAVVVNELWHKHPELVVPGWEDSHYYYEGVGYGNSWHGPEGSDGTARPATHATDADILAAAALCAKKLAKDGTSIGWYWVDECYQSMFAGGFTGDDLGTDCWESAVFRKILTEKGIEHD